jgi:excisionase family DNA binding protein
MSKTIAKVPAIVRHTKPPRQPSQTSGGEPLTSDFNRLYTIRQAADLTGIHYWLLLRAVNQGDVPSYHFGNARRRVRLPDIEAVISVAGHGGRA